MPADGFSDVISKVAAGHIRRKRRAVRRVGGEESDFNLIGGLIGLFHLERGHIGGIEIVAHVDDDIISRDDFILVQLVSHISQQRVLGFGVIGSLLRAGVLCNGRDHDQRRQQQRC